jgi:hypothetical protein
LDQSSLTSPDSISTNIVSQNGYWIVKLLDDGRLSLQDTYGVIWYTESNANLGTAPYKFKMGTNGRLYILDSTNAEKWYSAIWSGVSGNPPFRIFLQGDANLVVRSVDGTGMWAKNIYASFATKGCVKLYVDDKMGGTVTELCSDTASMPDKYRSCPCNSSCFPMTLDNWNFQGFQTATADSTNANLKILNFDAYGNDFYIGMLSSTTSSSMIYGIVVGGWANFRTKVVNSSKTAISGCEYLYGVPDTLAKTTYQIILDNTAKTLKMMVNGTQAFSCSIPTLTFSTVTQWAFSSSWPSQTICPLSSNVSTSATDCVLVGNSVTVYDQTNYTGNSVTVTNPLLNLGSINMHDKIASLKINPTCYLTCATCFEMGTNTDHKCCSCKTSYYPLSNNLFQCFTTSSPPEKYWFSSGSSQFRPCYSSCQSCASDGTASAHNCTTCITGYYKVMLTANCVNVAPENYYLNTSQSQYRPCYTNCATCSADGTASNMNCLTCKSGFFPIVDAPSTCTNTAPQYYYFNSSTNNYKPCYSSCATCNSDGDSTNHNCLTCKLTHIKQANTNNCLAQKLDPSSFVSQDTIDSTKKIVSPNEYWTLQLQNDGRLAVNDDYANNYYYLATATGTAPYTAKLQTDGVFYVYSSTNSVTWNTTRRTSVGGAPFRFQIQQDANLVITSADGPTVVWAPDIYVSSFPNLGCVWFYSGTKYSSTKTEFCGDNPNIPKTASSILLPERFLRCSCTSSCFKIIGASWTFTNFQAASEDITNSNLKILQFDAFGSDIVLGMLSSDNSASLVYGVVIGGFANLKTRVVNPSKTPLTGCDYNLLSVNNPYEATKYKFIIDNTAKTITMYSNGNKAFECSIPTLTYTSITHWGFSNSSPGQNINDIRFICPLDANGTSDASNCMWTTTTVRAYTDINYGGTETIINKPILALSAINKDKLFASIKISPECYSSCGTCNLLGTAENHKCCTCAANNFPIIGNTSQCFSSASPPANHWLNTNQFKPCFTTCLTCSNDGTDATQNCLTCKTGYYKLMSTSNCINVLPNNHYLNTNLNEYRPCYASCYTCSADGTAASHECLTCKSGNYPLIDNSKNCYDTTPNFYFFDSNLQKYNSCFSSCNTCSSIGTSDNHNCTICKPNNYKVGNTNNCFASTASVPNYYYNSSDNLFKSCPLNCSVCSDATTCTTCSSGYMLNTSNNNCETCYTGCSTCSGVGTESDQKCITCKTNYFLKNGTNNCFLSTTNMPGFFANTQLSKFMPCTQVKK